MLTVIAAVSDSGGAPLSVTSTVRLYVGVVSKSNEPATVIAPVDGLIANTPPVVPLVIENVWVCVASSSVNVTVPTAAPFAASSATLKVPSLATGASLTSTMLTVIVAVPDSGGVPLSVTCTVRAKVGVASKSSAAPDATVIAPVDGLIANALPVLPAVIANAWVWPASTSVNATVCTAVPLALFSSIDTVAAVTTGASLTSFRFTV